MTGLSEDEEPELSAQLSAIISNAQVGWLIAELGRQSALHVGSGRLRASAASNLSKSNRLRSSYSS